jgi:cytosine/creatinine deaminase
MSQLWDLVLADVQLPTGARADVGISGAHIGANEPTGSLVGHQRLDLSEFVVLPRLVDGHIHLDKTLLGLKWIPHVSGGSVRERIFAERQLRRSLEEPMKIRARRLVDHVIARGTLALRSHVDVDDEVQLHHLEELLELRDEVKPFVDIQLVAFPQSGVTSLKGGSDLLEAALKAGADQLGGLDPAGIDNDLEGQLNILFRLAAKYGVGLDIHLHDPGELGAYELRRIAERTRVEGLGGRVAVSHAYALGAVSESVFALTAEALAIADVAIMTNGPGTDPVPPLKRLMASGVMVFAGSDNIRDAWSPYGNGDMLDRVRHIGFLNGLQTDQELHDALKLATSHAATVLGLAPINLQPGDPADLVIVRAENVSEAVASAPVRHLVLRGGRVVARDGLLTSEQAKNP